MSSQRSNWRERLHANPSRMELELASRLQEDAITYLNLAVAILLPSPVPGCGWSWGPSCQLGLCYARFGPCCVGAQLLGCVMSDVVGSGWTQVTFLRTVGVGSPGLASLTPLSGGVGSGTSRVLFFVILSPRHDFFE